MVQPTPAISTVTGHIHYCRTNSRPLLKNKFNNSSFYCKFKNNWFSIIAAKSPQTMSATESVSGLRNSTSGQSISANTETTIQYANSEEDTHGMWSTSTYDWTVPVAGRYSVNGFF